MKKKNRKPNHSLEVLHEIYKEDIETSAELYLGRKMSDEECLEAYKLFSISSFSKSKQRMKRKRLSKLFPFSEILQVIKQIGISEKVLV